MGIKRNIVVDGMEVPFKASATVPRLYRMKFGRDIFKDFSTKTFPTILMTGLNSSTRLAFTKFYHSCLIYGDSTPKLSQLLKKT